MVGMESKLLQWRNALDEIDKQVIDLLAQRFKITHEVGVYKAEQGLHERDEKRENEMIDRIHAIAKAAGLEPTVAENYLKTIWTHSLEKHREIAQRKEGNNE